MPGAVPRGPWRDLKPAPPASQRKSWHPFPPTMDPGTDPLPGDVHLCGYLRKQKSQHRRYFVLRRASERGGPARLECYENEKKFRAGGPCGRPKRTFPLAAALNVSKRADARHRHLVVLYGRHGTFGLAADSAEQQHLWYTALLELHCKGKASLEGDLDMQRPRPAFKEVWQVSLRPRGLGHTRNLAGTYLLCLAEKTIDFVKLNSDVAAVVLPLLNVRRCGHSENYFFMEVGRSAVTGPGELWMQVDDLVVAQNMHETILEAMKALSEDFRLRSKSQTLASTPILVPPRCHQPLGNPSTSQGALSRRPRPDGTPCLGRSPASQRQEAAGPRKPDSLSDYSAISSDEGGSSPRDSRPPDTPDPFSYLVTEGELDYISMGKLASPDGHNLAKWASGTEPNKRASLPPLTLERDAPNLSSGKAALRPVAISASYPEGLNLRSSDPGYMAMLPRGPPGTEDQDYVPMTPGSVSPPRDSGGYMMMCPSGGCSPERRGLWEPGRGEGSYLGSDYVNMSPISRSASSTPPYSPLLPAPGGATFHSLPRSYRHAPPLPSCAVGRHSFSSSSSSASSENLGELTGTPERCPPSLLAELPGSATEVPARPRSPGEYVSIEYCSRAADYVTMGHGVGPPSRAAVPDPPGRRLHHPEAFPAAERTDVGLNYIDLDLGREATPIEATAPLRSFAEPSQGAVPHTYASIDFLRSGGLRPDSKGTET